MVRITYYRDANEGRTYDEPVKPNTILSKAFRSKAEYEAWLSEFPEVNVKTFFEFPSGGGLLGATARQIAAEYDEVNW